MIAFALICGASAAFGVSRVLRDPNRQVETVPVVEAAIDIGASFDGETIMCNIAQDARGFRQFHGTGGNLTGHGA